MDKILFVDATLRDGEQSVGVAFSAKEKVHIAGLLDAVGVYQIEAGIPAMGQLEMEAIYSILALNLKAKISTWNRTNLDDIKASLDCGARNLHISAPVSDIHIRYKLNRSREWVLDCMKRAVAYARDAGATVTVGAEDASRADMEFLLQFAREAKKEGAVYLRFADTLGVMDPFTTRNRVEQIIRRTGIDVEMHGHNDFGMATANSLAAYKAGARYLSTTVLGMGERAGNSPYEEVVEMLRYVEGIPLPVNETKLEELIRFVAGAANWPVKPLKMHGLRKAGVEKISLA